MAWTSVDLALGVVGLTDVDPTPGAVGRYPQFGAKVKGIDPSLGGGEFIFLKGVASLAVGDVVTYNGNTGATTRWAGTANTGAPIAVAITTPSSTQGGWFQIGGNAVINCTGTVAAGDPAFFSATASVKTAAAAGKQVMGAVADTANGATVGTITLASTQAVYSIDRPHVQGQIT
jgi:hypothetical protein